MTDALLRKLAEYIVAELIQHIDGIGAAIAAEVAKDITIASIDPVALARAVVDGVVSKIPFLK